MPFGAFILIVNTMTEKEQEVMNLLIEAHNKYYQLEPTHPSDGQEWMLSFHRLQSLLGSRVLRRDYPNMYYTQNL